MKLLKHLFIAATTVLAAATATMAAADSDAAISFKETSHDFGTIREKGGAVSHEFTFTNTGSSPLIIVNATASCGCTRPDFPKKPIAAGKSGTIKVTYLPDGRPGEFNKTVTVKTNSKKQKKVTLKIKGFVTPAS
jgi:hypothetical protein